MATLSDPIVQKSITDFTSEAKQCARRGNGFAAMSTVFNVVLAVSEAVFQDDNNLDRISRFVEEMRDVSSWLLTTAGQPSNAEVARTLTDIRNGFAHALSMPPNSALKNTIGEAANHASLTACVSPGTREYFISVPDFVEAVTATVKRLSAKYPNSLFDPSKGKRLRGPARGFSSRG